MCCSPRTSPRTPKVAGGTALKRGTASSALLRHVPRVDRASSACRVARLTSARLLVRGGLANAVGSSIRRPVRCKSSVPANVSVVAPPARNAGRSLLSRATPRAAFARLNALMRTESQLAVDSRMATATGWSKSLWGRSAPSFQAIEIPDGCLSTATSWVKSSAVQWTPSSRSTTSTEIEPTTALRTSSFGARLTGRASYSLVSIAAPRTSGRSPSPSGRAI